MEKLNLKNVAIPVISLFTICVVVTFALAATNIFTEKKVKEQNMLSEQSSRQIVLPNSKSFNQKTFRSTEYYEGINSSGQVEGFVFNTEARGYGGTIKIMVGITADSKVSGVNILSQNETPGLGANIKNDNFKNQFIGLVPQSEFSVVKGKAASDSQIEALTGATISSKAVTSAVNDAIDLFKEIKAGGEI
ncbi:MAG: H+/Na+-translocating ferredoxin:NAD+ oxidoreductase subunit G [Eubacteriales bacterium SKADARSKE-1]|nr:H+/Na+-translocating ferredoxin:NAD+ oxidoreductase subunit G [Eubacteriales bacterium SKADARSKE-1]